jgi:hypothetical protein
MGDKENTAVAWKGFLNKFYPFLRWQKIEKKT